MSRQKVEDEGVIELIRKLPESWRCSLSETEPKLSRALSWPT